MQVWLLLLAFLIAQDSFAQSYSPKKEATICYFSLNNTKEFKTMQNFARQLNSKNQAGGKIHVVEYMQTRGSPEEAFKRMIEDMNAKNQKCDGLVISGHHTGSWGGHNADGTLSLDFLETASCNPKYKAWFESISALWLQGCRTLGVNAITPNDTPNHHLERLRHNPQARQDQTLADADNLQQGGAAINYEFSNTLDQDNPLHQRYLRMFPSATVFGWTRSAPGENSGSDRSLLFHIAQMTRNNNYLANPFGNFSAHDATAMMNAVLDIIHKPNHHCEPRSITAWNRQGKDRTLGFNNSDVAAYSSISSPEEARAKELGCKLKFATSQEERKQALREILQNPRYLAINFNIILELAQKPYFKNEKDNADASIRRAGGTLLSEVEKGELVSMLRGSENLKSFLGNKISAFYTGVFPKIDYYTFYKKVFGTTSPDLEKIINSTLLDYLGKSYPRTESQAVRDAFHMDKVALYNSLVKNDYITESFLNELASRPEEEARNSVTNICAKLFALNKDGFKVCRDRGY